jgi:hypothetical protein
MVSAKAVLLGKTDFLPFIVITSKLQVLPKFSQPIQTANSYSCLKTWLKGQLFNR